MEPEKKSNGALVGLIVIVIILIIGGIYIWRSNDNNTAPVQSETVTNQDSSDLDALEQDLGTVDTNVGVDVDTVN